MKFANYRSLKIGAQRALQKARENNGIYKGRKYIADVTTGKEYIACIDEQGRAMDWVLIIHSNGPTIKEKRA